MKFIELTLLQSNKVDLLNEELNRELRKLSRCEVEEWLLDKKIKAEDFVFTDDILTYINMENSLYWHPYFATNLIFALDIGDASVCVKDASLIPQVTKIIFVDGKEVFVKENCETLNKLLSK